jgi:hypothetical protein
MNPYTNHLVADISSLAVDERKHYKSIPKHLQPEAERELAGRESVYVNPNTAKNLAAWAAKKRDKNRAKAKMAKAARKRSRKS